MKSTKQFNNISDGLKKQIPKLKPNEVVVFQMLNGVPNPEPDDKERNRQGLILYPKTQVMTQFRIYDKDKKSEGSDQEGEYVDIVLADGWIGEIPSKARCFVPGNENGLAGSRFQGKFQCVGGVVKDEELFEVLYLSPQRKGTPCPDPSVEQIFEIVDLKASTKDSLGKFDKLKRVLDIVSKIEEADARSIMRALGQPEYQDKDVLMAKTKELATTKVDDFLITYDNKGRSLKSDITEAILTGVIFHDLSTGDITLGKTKVANIKVSNPDALPEAFMQWIVTSTNGQDVWNNIKAQMKKPTQAETSSNQ